jgi:hypothetical protein
MSLSLRTSGSEASQPAFKHLTRILREIDRRAVLSLPRSPNERSEMAALFSSTPSSLSTASTTAPGWGASGDNHQVGSAVRVVLLPPPDPARPMRSSIGDPMKIGGTDARVFLQRPFGHYTEPGGSSGDLPPISLVTTTEDSNLTAPARRALDVDRDVCGPLESPIAVH